MMLYVLICLYVSSIHIALPIQERHRGGCGDGTGIIWLLGKHEDMRFIPRTYVKIAEHDGRYLWFHYSRRGDSRITRDSRTDSLAYMSSFKPMIMSQNKDGWHLRNSIQGCSMTPYMHTHTWLCMCAHMYQYIPPPSLSLSHLLGSQCMRSSILVDLNVSK